MGARRSSSDIPRVLGHDGMKAVLEANGWTATTGGKHSTKMEKPGKRPITIPRHRGQDYGQDLTNRILRQAELNRSRKDADTKIEQPAEEDSEKASVESL